MLMHQTELLNIRTQTCNIQDSWTVNSNHKFKQTIHTKEILRLFILINRQNSVAFVLGCVNITKAMIGS